MNVHVPGEDITEGVSLVPSYSLVRSGADSRQYAWFGGILGCLAAFAVVGAWATVSL